jgi:hypothetical protein
VKEVKQGSHAVFGSEHHCPPVSRSQIRFQESL